MTLDQLAVLNQPNPSVTGGQTVMSDLITYVRDPELYDAFIARYRLGIARYGVPLHTEDGRNTKADLLQELLDAALYAHKGYMETEHLTYARIRESLLMYISILRGIDEVARQD